MECSIGKVITEEMSSEEREKRFKFCLDLSDSYLEILHEIFDYLKEQQLVAREREVMHLEKEEYISVLLERRHQEDYKKILNLIKQPGDVEWSEKEKESLQICMEDFYKDQKVEICNNFYEFPAEITKPYLAQMKRQFAQHLLELKNSENILPSLKHFKERCLVQLEDLCKQILQLQARQASGPYVKSLSELLPKDKPFVRFLLLQRPGMISEYRKTNLSEFEIIENIAVILGISETQVIKYI